MTREASRKTHEPCLMRVIGMISDKMLATHQMTTAQYDWVMRRKETSNADPRSFLLIGSV